MLVGMLARALDSGWSQLSEDIGLWIPVEFHNKEHDDKPEGAADEGNISKPVFIFQLKIHPNLQLSLQSRLPNLFFLQVPLQIFSFSFYLYAKERIFFVFFIFNFKLFRSLEN